MRGMQPEYSGSEMTAAGRSILARLTEHGAGATRPAWFCLAQQDKIEFRRTRVLKHVYRGAGQPPSAARNRPRAGRTENGRFLGR